MMALYVLIACIASSNFSIIAVMRMEGIRALRSWKTVAVALLLVPVLTFIILCVIVDLVMIYD